jgi:hypothetical protein
MIFCPQRLSSIAIMRCSEYQRRDGCGAGCPNAATEDQLIRLNKIRDPEIEKGPEKYTIDELVKEGFLDSDAAIRDAISCGALKAELARSRETYVAESGSSKVRLGRLLKIGGIRENQEPTSFANWRQKKRFEPGLFTGRSEGKRFTLSPQKSGSTTNSGVFFSLTSKIGKRTKKLSSERPSTQSLREELWRG